MKFQKWICLIMLIVGALATLYAFCYCTGSLAELGQAFKIVNGENVPVFEAAEGKYDTGLYTEIQGFNNLMMYCGIAMILLAVLLYITACQSRRNYYASNYVAIGLCAVADVIISVVLMVMNGIWKSKFLNVDFEAWKAYYQVYIDIGADPSTIHYSESTLWFDIGYVVYAIVIVAAIALILNLVWKVLLMRGEKKLLSGSALAGGAV